MKYRFEPRALHEMIDRFRIRSLKFELQGSENQSAEDDIGYVSRSSSEEIDEKRRNISDPRDMLYAYLQYFHTLIFPEISLYLIFF